mmetsp:Transcript_84925/g.253158  ORF Transcript_84925/g.253158 Transcript_84925/m.253158 type:complete len:259 (+) Transcript_84925:119-895(+)
MSGRRNRAARPAALGAAALLAAALLYAGVKSLGWAVAGLHGVSVGRAGHGVQPLGLWPTSMLQGRAKTTMAATATDTFDPWTVLGISTDAGTPEARNAYKKLIAKYHPDVDPSPEAADKFQDVVRAHAVITGEDRELDMSTLLKNTVDNLRNDIEFRKQQIENMKIKAEKEEAAVLKMQAQLEQAEVKREKVTQELGAYGGGALGLLVAGPAGAVVGAAVGLALKDRDDAVGQVIRGVGTLTKGVVDAVGKSISRKSK